MIINCSFCGKSLNRKPSRIKKYKNQYCDNSCKNKHQKVISTGKDNPNYKNSLIKICSYCGKEYKHYSKDRKFCSCRCRDLHRKKEFICDNCGLKFLDTPSKHDGLKGSFCSIKCYSESCNLKLICNNCNKEFITKNHLRNKKYCSLNCFYKHKKITNKGKGNPRWLGGISQYRGNDWKEQRLKAFERDEGACQICGSQERIAVHHIIPYRISKDNRLKNLICLCSKHHGKEENYYRQFKKISNRVLNFILHGNTESNESIIRKQEEYPDGIKMEVIRC